MLDDATLARWLEQMQLAAVPHGAGTLRYVQPTAAGDIEVYLRRDENWLIASVVPFLATRGSNPFELSRWLLRMNHDMKQVKFAYDEDGDVALSVELPTENVDYSEFETALSALMRHAVQHKLALREAARGTGQ